MIISEARRHFLAHGFRGVTMDDLAAELRMSKRTLYEQFASKQVLLAAVIEQKLSAVDADLKRVTEHSADDFSKALSELLACLREHTQELQPPFIRDIGREAPELFQQVQSKRRALIRRHFGKLLEEGRKAGMIRKDVSTDLMLEILVNTTDSMINPTRLTELQLDARTCLSAIVEIFLKGVLTRKGRKQQ